MSDPNGTFATFNGVIHLIISGATSLVIILGIWILNSVSKGLSKIEKTLDDSVKRIHERIDAIVEDRTEKWIEKEKDCRQEDKRLARLEERVRIEEHRK